MEENNTQAPPAPAPVPQPMPLDPAPATLEANPAPAPVPIFAPVPMPEPAPVIPEETPAKTVLLVEDDLFLSNLLSSRLIRAGINLVKAYDGEEAMRILRSQRPDLIILDIIVPKKSGFEVLEEIRGEPTLQDVPVMVLSNLGQDADVARAKQLGAVQYFIKAQNSIGAITDAITNFLQV